MSNKDADERLRVEEAKLKADAPRRDSFAWWAAQLGLSPEDIKRAGGLMISDTYPFPHDIMVYPEEMTIKAEHLLHYLNEYFTWEQRQLLILYYYQRWCVDWGFASFFEVTIPVPDEVRRYLSSGCLVTPLAQEAINKLLPYIWEKQLGVAQGVLSGHELLVGRLLYEKEVPDLIGALMPLPDHLVSEPDVRKWLNKMFRIRRKSSSEPIRRTSLQDALIKNKIQFS